MVKMHDMKTPMVKDAKKDSSVKSSKFLKVDRPLSTQHEIYLSDSFSSDSLDYVELISILGDIDSSDLVILHMGNFGGAVHVGMRVAQAIHECEATTLIKVEAPCYSMGAIVAVSGDGLLMDPGTFLMFHNYSSLSYGKGAELKMSTEATAKYFGKILQEYCYPFLTKAEIRRIVTDQDIYIHEDDEGLLKRMKRHYKNLEIVS